MKHLSLRISNAKQMKHVIARVIACSFMLLVLPSCGIPLRKAESPPGLPETLNGGTSSENSSQLTIEEFYQDPALTSLICQAVASNRELKVLNEDVQIASNQILSRSGAYLPFVTAGAGAGLNRASRFTLEGAAVLNDPFLPGQFFSLAHGEFGGGINLNWQLDIYRQLRNARDAAGQRFNVALERRNFFITRLVADVAENYYRLMALDKRLENLNLTIELQERSLEIAQALKEAARITELGVLRFQAEVRKNQSEKLIVHQDIVVTENKINFLLNRFPQPVERVSAGFYDLNINRLSVGVPSQLLQNRPDIRQAERDLAATGLDVKVARVNFFPQLVISGGTGLESLVINHLFEPQAVIGTIASGLVGPLVNKRAIRAEYLTANARQLQAIYTYQRVVLNAFTEVVNRLSMVEKYTTSIELKKQQMAALEASVEVASNLFQNARVEYIDVLLAQRDLRDARGTLIDTKVEQLVAIVNTYQALGGGLLSNPNAAVVPGQNPYIHTVSSGETFRTISQRYYESERYSKALWAANKSAVPAPDRLKVGDKIIIPRADQLDQSLIDVGPTPGPARPGTAPGDEPAILPPPVPPPASMPGPFGEKETRDPAVKATGGTKPAVASPNPVTRK
ncbi:TolC family protein [Singulisphaera sp. Ch08]|uniref:TolC family protein n=1 Tax=Singulisphaera sp. Ch08 TaxID=3120278 RepID=A0AAU7CCR6_9BACT